MKFLVDGLTVLFPYPKIYPEQYAYMCDLKKALDAGGVGLLEMPSVAGKEVSLLSFLVAYQEHQSSQRRLIYCCRTASQIDRISIGLKALMKYRASKHGHRDQLPPHLDSTAIRDRPERQFLQINHGSIVLCTHRYLLDPAFGSVWRHLPEDSILVFDQAHNIDNVCIKSLSSEITVSTLQQASKHIAFLEQTVRETEPENHRRLEAEYRQYVASDRVTNDASNSVVLPDDVPYEAMPGNIRKADHFVAFLKRLVEYLKVRIKPGQALSETPAAFATHLKEHTFIERKPLQFSLQRISSLYETLDLTDTTLPDYRALRKVLVFATRAATYDDGFAVILEPPSAGTDGAPPDDDDPALHFVCLDASIAIRPLFRRFASTVITSDTLSPIDIYPHILGFKPILTVSYTLTLTRPSILPMIVTRGGDQTAMSTARLTRNEPSVMRNYGKLVVDFAKMTPDGVLVVFPSYAYMESVISVWQGMGILDEIWGYKLILIETPHARETSLALETYRAACSNGRGALFFCVAGGCVAGVGSAVPLDHQYGRAVVCIGVPFPPAPTETSRILQARLDFLRSSSGVRENDFLSFDAMRRICEYMARIVRGKDDYGVMILADRRFQPEKRREQLPDWIRALLLDSNTNLSSDMAVANSRLFLKAMAQPFSSQDQVGVSTWSSQDVRRHQAGKMDLD